ncbi:MAG: aminotransferase class V-fold PLP-dependent enzyme [Acidobacteria bacterium]|nr:aminotransferase class V-fold PLP-dependent enzyme [Acidobacteriota bacterium]
MLTARVVDPAVESFESLRGREFSRLDEQGHAYLDYTGSALYAESQLRAHHALLSGGIFGNPHSDSGPSRASTGIIDLARRRVLRFLGTDEQTHDVVFTANASAAIKLVAESYPFRPGRSLLLTADNHNSVNGIREYARRAGARVGILPLDADLRLSRPEAYLEAAPSGGGLFAFPAQSNFSGVRHSLLLVERARDLGFEVLLDAAAYVPSRALSLRHCPADFVALSFYKLFGYPTGLGALVARRESLSLLRRPWFAGGTVEYASVAADTYRLREGHEGFEDGTPSFLAIAALDAGFDLVERVGMCRISAHVASLTRLLLSGLGDLRHTDGAPLVWIHGPRSGDDRGGTVAFNVLDPRGRVLPYAEVEARARTRGVSLRGGCFCNPGASESAFGLGRERIEACLLKLEGGFTVERFGACLGTAVGAVRASVGLANVPEDVHRALDVVRSFRF